MLKKVLLQKECGHLIIDQYIGIRIGRISSMEKNMVDDKIFYIKSNKIYVKEDDDTKMFLEPYWMLEIMDLLANKSYELDEESVTKIAKNTRAEFDIDDDRVLDYFCSIMTGVNTGKALKAMAECNLIHLILGDLAKRFSRVQVEHFYILADNIDKTHRVLERRLGLFYRILSKKDAIKAIELLPYNSKITQHLTDAVIQMDTLHFMREKTELKTFLLNHGMERYDYLHDLSKAERIVYDMADTKIQNRIHMLEQINTYNEPIFVEDLAIDAKDLIEYGICTEEEAPELLELVVPYVHKVPKFNTKKLLLKQAKKLSKSKIRRAFRGVRWIK